MDAGEGSDLVAGAELEHATGEGELGLTERRELSPADHGALGEACARKLAPLLGRHRRELAGEPVGLSLEQGLGLGLLVLGRVAPPEAFLLGCLDLADEVPEPAVVDRYGSQHLIGRLAMIDSGFVDEEKVAHPHPWP